MSDGEMMEIQRQARRAGLTLGGWVRRVLREEFAAEAPSEAEAKLKALRRGEQGD